MDSGLLYDASKYFPVYIVISKATIRIFIMRYSPIQKMLRVTDEALAIYSTMPLRMFVILLLVADKDGCVQSDIMKRLNVSQAVVSRMLITLGEEKHREVENPLGLVRQKENPKDWRSKTIHLTEKGKRLVEKFLNHLSA